MSTKTSSVRINGFWTNFKRRVHDRHIRHYRDSYFNLWADLLLGGIVVALLYLVLAFVFWRPVPAFSSKIELASARVLSGELQTFTIAYENREEGELNGAEIALNLPSQFMVQAAAPAETYDANAGVFRLGKLARGKKGSVQISGIVRGAPGEHQVFGYEINYYQGRLRRQLVDSLSYQINGSALGVSLEMPDQVYKGVDVPVRVVLKNNGHVALSNFSLVFPDEEWDVTVNGEDQGNNSFKMPELEVGAEYAAELMARPSKIGESEFTAEARTKVDNVEILQVSARKHLMVEEPVLDFKPSLSPRALEASRPRFSLEATLHNNAQTELKNLSITIVPNVERMRISNVRPLSEGVSARGVMLNFGTLAARSSTKLSAEASLERDSVVLNDRSSFGALIHYEMDGRAYDYTVALGSLKFNSNLSLNSAGYYYGPQGDQLGVGPLPPKTDIPTTYWVIWQANNLGNDIDALEVSAELPVNVVWAEQESLTAGTLSYSPVTRRVVWKAGAVAKAGGNYRASFAITLLPKAKDEGTVPILLNSISFKGNDLFTAQTLTKNLPVIDANIVSDSRASGKGKVEPN